VTRHTGSGRAIRNRSGDAHRILRPVTLATGRRQAVIAILIIGVLEIATAGAVVYTSGFTLEFKL
jgi:hypothetical protein